MRGVEGNKESPEVYDILGEILKLLYGGIQFSSCIDKKIRLSYVFFVKTGLKKVKGGSDKLVVYIPRKCGYTL